MWKEYYVFWLQCWDQVWMGMGEGRHRENNRERIVAPHGRLVVAQATMAAMQSSRSDQFWRYIQRKETWSPDGLNLVCERKGGGMYDCKAFGWVAGGWTCHQRDGEGCEWVMFGRSDQAFCFANAECSVSMWHRWSWRKGNCIVTSVVQICTGDRNLEGVGLHMLFKALRPNEIPQGSDWEVTEPLRTPI